MKHIQKFENYSKVNESFVLGGLVLLSKIAVAAFSIYGITKAFQFFDEQKFKQNYEKTDETVEIEYSKIDQITGEKLNEIQINEKFKLEVLRKKKTEPKAQAQKETKEPKFYSFQTAVYDDEGKRQPDEIVVLNQTQFDQLKEDIANKQLDPKTYFSQQKNLKGKKTYVPLQWLS